MASFDDMILRVQRLLGNHTQLTNPIVGELVNSRHRHLLESNDWARKKQEININTSADVSSGTITMTNGDATVAASGTPFASGDVGKYISVIDQLFVIGTFTSSSSVEITDLNGTTVTYPGTTASGESYVMFQRWYSLTAGVESINSVFYKIRLKEKDLGFLDALDPLRTTTSDPTYFARGPRDQSSTNDLVRIELWPRPSAAISVTLGVTLGHTDLAGVTNPIVPSGVVEWYAAEDAAYYLWSKTADKQYQVAAKDFDREGEKSLDRELRFDGEKHGLSQGIKGEDRSLVGTDFGVARDLWRS